MTSARSTWLLRVACVVALLALGLMAWSILDPRPGPVVIAMSVGQGLGTLSLLAFVVVVLPDIRVALRARRSLPPPPRSS